MLENIVSTSTTSGAIIRTVELGLTVANTAMNVHNTVKIRKIEKKLDSVGNAASKAVSEGRHTYDALQAAVNQFGPAATNPTAVGTVNVTAAVPTETVAVEVVSEGDGNEPVVSTVPEETDTKDETKEDVEVKDESKKDEPKTSKKK